jgi:hypothetical protein
MKNPYMSAWLSAANTAAAPMRGAWAAEASRQQTAMVKAWTEMWVKMWMPWMR